MKCENADAKYGGYYIGRATPRGEYTLRFVAKLNWINEAPILSRLNAKQGECNDLKTYAGSHKCGIAKQLMMVCLDDKYVTSHGGLRVRQYNMREKIRFAVWDDPAFIKDARRYCKTIVAISCDPFNKTPLIVCKAYIEAARKKNYQMMFVSKVIAKYQVFETKNGEVEFVKNPKKFLRDKGRDWFFCKCERGKNKECHNLKQYPKY